MSDKLNFSKVAIKNITVRNDRPVTLKFYANENTALDPANIIFKIGINNGLLKQLTINNGIINHGDGSFTVTFSGRDFNYVSEVDYELFGLQGLPNQEIMIGKIIHVKGIR